MDCETVQQALAASMSSLKHVEYVTAQSHGTNAPVRGMKYEEWHRLCVSPSALEGKELWPTMFSKGV